MAALMFSPLVNFRLSSPRVRSPTRTSRCHLPFSSFSGQKLLIGSRHNQVNFNNSVIPIKASHISHDIIESSEHILDDVSHWISKKIAQTMKPYLPENFNAITLVPGGLKSRIVSVERAGAVLVRECLILTFFYYLFARVEGFCRWLNRIYYSRTHAGQKPTEADYEASSYSALEGPLKASIVLWESTRMLYLASPLLRLKITLAMIGKVRVVGSILVITWFLFRWKDLVIKQLILRNKENTPQIIAFDKVVSLVMYYIAGTCIGEVSGFALGSVLAVGGVSGIAIGLAAKEIVGNFLGGTFLFLTRPFVIGDRVKAESFEGWVEDIDFLHTKVIGHDRSPMVVPNQAIVNEVIVNYTRAKCKRLVASFKLHNEDIFVVDKITDEITKYLQHHPKIDLSHGQPVCYLKSMGSHGLEIEMIASIKETEPVFEVPVEFFKTRQKILVKAAEIVRDAGAKIETEMPVD